MSDGVQIFYIVFISSTEHNTALKMYCIYFILQNLTFNIFYVIPFELTRTLKDETHMYCE